jgi:hypothetical protein
MQSASPIGDWAGHFVALQKQSIYWERLGPLRRTNIDRKMAGHAKLI